MYILRRVVHAGLCCAPSPVPFFHHSCITHPSVSLSVLSNCLGCILFVVVYFSFQSLQPSAWRHHRPSVMAAFMPSVVSDLSTSHSLHTPFVVGFLAIYGNLEDDLVTFPRQRAGLKEWIGKWRDGRFLVRLFSIRASWKRTRGCTWHCGAAHTR